MAKNLPLTWSPTENLAWRTPLPKDELDAIRYSTVGDVVYGGEVADGAFVARTGTELICVRSAGRSNRTGSDR